MRNILVFIICLTLFFCLCVGSDITPYLRGPAPYPPDWRWDYLFVNTYPKIWVPLLVSFLSLYLYKKIDFKKLNDLNDEEIISELIKLKGIGKWTAEMFLMFTLGRKDVFSAGDLGLKNAMIKIYNLDKPTQEELLSISKKWSPHRTVASRILWKSLEKKAS
jgi:hypothetical protein